MGANTAVFSVMNAVLLQVAAGGRSASPGLFADVRIRRAERAPSTPTRHFPIPCTTRCASKAAAFSPLIAYVPLSGSKVAVRYGAQPEEAEGDMVSGTFFSGLGVNLPLGRGFSETGRNRPCADCRDQLQLLDAAVCARARMCWERRCIVNGVPMTIVGVAAQGFEGVEGGRLDRLLDSAAEPPRAECVGQSSGGRQTLHREFHMVVPAADRAACSRREPNAGGGAIATSLSDSSLCRAWARPMEGEKLPVLSFADAKELSRIRRAIRQSAAHPDGDGGPGVADRADQCGDAADGAQCSAAAGVFRCGWRWERAAANCSGNC